MANKTNHKFGVIQGTPSQLLDASTIEEGKLYFLSGDAVGAVKQGIYGINPLATGEHKTLTMFATGAVADGSGYGLSQDNFTTTEKNKLATLSNYILPNASDNTLGGIKTNYESIGKNYPVKVDGSGNAYVNVPWLDKAEDASKADFATIAGKVSNTLIIQGNGSIVSEFDGSISKTLNIVPGTNVSIVTDSSNGKITISADVPGALVYQGVVATISEINGKNCEEKNKGDVYVASANFTGTITKNNATYSIERGDMFICNGSSWDIVNGEGQVTNGGVTLEYAKSATIATVDGVDITLTGPATPVTSLGEKTGAITLGTATKDDDKIVNFSIDGNNKMTAYVPSLDNYLKKEDANYFGSVNGISAADVDTLTFQAGDNITIEADSTMGEITIYSTDTVCTSATLNVDSSADVPTTLYADVVSNTKISLSGSGTSLTGTMTSVRVATQKAVDAAQSAAIEAATIYWETL